MTELLIDAALICGPSLAVFAVLYWATHRIERRRIALNDPRWCGATQCGVMAPAAHVENCQCSLCSTAHSPTQAEGWRSQWDIR